MAMNPLVSGMLRVLKVSLPDPLDMLSEHISELKARRLFFKLEGGVKEKLAAIEKKINGDAYVKSVMIDFDDVPTLNQSTKIDQSLI